MDLPTQTQLGQAFLYLLPSGVVWDKSQGSILQQFGQAIAKGPLMALVNTQKLQTELQPWSTSELLWTWLESLGLPDNCLSADATDNQLKAQLIAKFSNSGGQTQAFYINYAQNLAYAVTIKTYASCKAGTMVAGACSPTSSDKVIYNVTFIVEGATSAPILECEINKLKSAHMAFWFHYPDASE